MLPSGEHGVNHARQIADQRMPGQIRVEVEARRDAEAIQSSGEERCIDFGAANDDADVAKRPSGGSFFEDAARDLIGLSLDGGSFAEPGAGLDTLALTEFLGEAHGQQARASSRGDIGERQRSVTSAWRHSAAITDSSGSGRA